MEWKGQKTLDGKNRQYQSHARKNKNGLDPHNLLEKTCNVMVALSRFDGGSRASVGPN